MRRRGEVIGGGSNRGGEEITGEGRKKVYGYRNAI